ncbi:MAG: HRDC domain-containing protein [Gemmatimonadaceae bacterium]|nr:HRDC domain-containing protein [Gemmatimonadaceae bacterium]
MTTPQFDYFDTPAAADQWFQSLGAIRTLAIDTEGASFHRFVDRIYLLQLTAAGRHAILDPLPIGSLAALGALLESPEVEVIFHDADYDLRLLHQDYGWHVRRIFDTRIAAQLLGVKAFGLAALLEQHFGIKLDKKHQRADWSMRPLTDDMLAYAVLDTAWLPELRDKMAEQLQQKQRWSWAAEEFARLEGTRWPVEEPDTAFLRVKGARDLTRRELARLRELVPWRDARAKELDRSTFRVLGNDVLLEIVKVTDVSKQVLSQVKGMPRGLFERYASELLDMLKRADALPEAQLPRFPKGPRFSRDPDFDHKVGQLKAVRDAWATKLDLDPGVLCSRERLEAVVRRLPRDVSEFAELPELRKWQVELMGAEFVKALAKFSPVDSPYADA